MAPYLWILGGGAWLFVSAFLFDQPLPAALATAVVALAAMGLSFADTGRVAVKGMVAVLALVLACGAVLLPGASAATRASELVVALVLLIAALAHSRRHPDQVPDAHHHSA